MRKGGPVAYHAIPLVRAQLLSFLSSVRGAARSLSRRPRRAIAGLHASFGLRRVLPRPRWRELSRCMRMTSREAASLPCFTSKSLPSTHFSSSRAAPPLPPSTTPPDRYRLPPAPALRCMRLPRPPHAPCGRRFRWRRPGRHKLSAHHRPRFRRLLSAPSLSQPLHLLRGHMPAPR